MREASEVHDVLLSFHSWLRDIILYKTIFTGTMGAGSFSSVPAPILFRSDAFSSYRV